MDKNIDIAILTTNKWEELKPLYLKLSTQSVKPHKIFLLNTVSNSEKNKYDDEEVKKYIRDILINKNIDFECIMINKKDFNHGSTRNIAAKASNADYIIYMTDDAEPVDDYLIEKLLAGMNRSIDIKDKIKDKSDRIVAASYARQIARRDASFIEKKVREYNYKDISFENNESTASIRGIKNIFLSNVCAIYDLNILKENGYFEENIDFNEDTLYADKIIKKGYSIIYNAEAKVYHSHNYSYIEQYNRNVLIGKSHATHPEVFGVYKSEGEGTKLASFVCIECIKRLKFMSMLSFIIECIYRYKGYKDGKKLGK